MTPLDLKLDLKKYVKEKKEVLIVILVDFETSKAEYYDELFEAILEDQIIKSINAFDYFNQGRYQFEHFSTLDEYYYLLPYKHNFCGALSEHFLDKAKQLFQTFIIERIRLRTLYNWLDALHAKAIPIEQSSNDITHDIAHYNDTFVNIKTQIVFDEMMKIKGIGTSGVDVSLYIHFLSELNGIRPNFGRVEFMNWLSVTYEVVISRIQSKSSIRNYDKRVAVLKGVVKSSLEAM